MIHDSYMTTGELAKLMKVSKHTLFHYDDIGLFSPEEVGDNGYRYYSVYQMETLDTILWLKKSGMSLHEIKDFMKDRSPDKFLKIFETRQQEIDLEIARLQVMKEWMEQRKEKIRYVQNCDFSEIRRIHHAERYYLYEKLEENPTDRDFFLKINQLIIKMEELKADIDYDIAYMQSPEEIEHGIYNGYHNVILLMQSKIPAEDMRILPEGEYVTAYHVGHWKDIGNTYQRLLKYIYEHELETVGEYLEYYVIDNCVAKDIRDYVTEISIRIK